MTIQYLAKILKSFSIPEGEFNFSVLHSGYINQTYLIETRSISSKKLILQSINTKIFPDVIALMNNTIIVCEHIEQKLRSASDKIKYANLHFYKTTEEKAYLKQGDEYFCLLDYIENQPTESHDISINTAKEAGRILGVFHQLTNDIDPNEIVEIIPNFHRIDLRFKHFKAIQLLDNSRYKATNVFYKKVMAFQYLVNDFIKILGKKELPIKVVHNDPKVSNILFDKNGKGITMIDLDTVMPGFLGNDYGDAIRSLTNTSDENETDLKKVDFNFLLFKAFTKAYLSEVKETITASEKEHLALFTLLITYEQLIRFYGDYLENDVYYQTNYPTHNLQRAKVQLKLLQQMVLKFKEMENFIVSAL